MTVPTPPTGPTAGDAHTQAREWLAARLADAAAEYAGIRPVEPGRPESPSGRLTLWGRYADAVLAGCAVHDLRGLGGGCGLLIVVPAAVLAGFGDPPPVETPSADRPRIAVEPRTGPGGWDGTPGGGSGHPEADESGPADRSEMT